MTISYPLTLPTGPTGELYSFSSFELAPMWANSDSASPFSFNEQIYAHTGDRWGLLLEYPPLKETQARSMIAFLASLRGRVGYFSFGDPNMIAPKGNAGGTPLVKGGSQTGLSLITDGWSATVTNILKAGDYFQLGNYLYMNLKDVNSNGSGEATLDIFPRLRSSPADNAALTLSSPKGIFRLTSASTGWSIDKDRLYNVSIAAVEAI